MPNQVLLKLFYYFLNQLWLVSCKLLCKFWQHAEICVSLRNFGKDEYPILTINIPCHLKKNLFWLILLCTTDYNRYLMVSTDQADPSCFYFRISWILMEQHWSYFFHPLHLVQGLRSNSIKLVITTLLFKLGKS